MMLRNAACVDGLFVLFARRYGRCELLKVVSRGIHPQTSSATLYHSITSYIGSWQWLHCLVCNPSSCDETWHEPSPFSTPACPVAAAHSMPPKRQSRVGDGGVYKFVEQDVFRIIHNFAARVQQQHDPPDPPTLATFKSVFATNHGWFLFAVRAPTCTRAHGHPPGKQRPHPPRPIPPSALLHGPRLPASQPCRPL